MSRILTAALVAAPLLTACGVAGDNELSIMPDERILVNLPVGNDLAKDAADGEWSNMYLLTLQTTENVNGVIRGVLWLVDAVTDTPPTYLDVEENHAWWGPYSDALDPVETALGVEYHPEDDTYTWAFVQKPRGADDSEYVTVVAGEVDAGATEEASSGRFAVDFATIQDLNPTEDADGYFYSEYTIGPDGVSATAAFDASEDGLGEADAGYAYEQVHGGEGAMDLAFLHDVNDNGTEELNIVRSRWLADGQGRSDVYLTDGDLGESVVTAAECWDGKFNAVYQENSFTGATMGDVGACAYEEAEYNE